MADTDMEMTSPAIEPAADFAADDFGPGDHEETGMEQNITTDGGVIKKILVAGSGWEKPERGDLVKVHYVGTLKDGTQFDSSRDRNEPFTFNLGEGRVIKGWDLGVASMLKGEKAILTCRADYAYGESGSPPKIPPGATLDFEVELLDWTSLKDIAGDGGVIKTIVKEGNGWEKPQDRDEVLVAYSARVQGQTEPFASSGPEGVRFSVSEGLPGLRGLQVAVTTMKKEEEATLVLKPEYAYGAEGLEGKVPANATVEVDLTLLSWHKVEDVTDDGLVVKKTLKDSSEWKRPNEGAKVTLRVRGTLEDGTVFLDCAEGHEMTFVTDEKQVPEGLEQAVMKMKVGEHALVTVAAQYGYGAEGKALEATTTTGQVAAVPPNANLTYDIELVSLENSKESWEMSDEEKVEAAGVKKEKANAAYREGRTGRAIQLYTKAVGLVNSDSKFTDELKTKAKELRRAIHLNLAAAHLKASNWREAVTQASKVLEIEPGSVKALYRRAQAFIGSGDYVEAEQDIKRGLAEEATNSDLTALYRKLKVLMKDQAKKEASLYSRMFKPTKATTSPTTTNPATDATPDTEPKDNGMAVDVQPAPVQAH